MKKLAIITSHPIQYQAPLFKELARSFDLRVLFCWDFGVRESLDKEFGIKMKWDTPLLDGYAYKFLNNFSFHPSSEFWGQINFGVVLELLKFRPEALIIFGWNSFTNFLAFIVAKFLGVRVFMRGENPLNQELRKSKRKIFLKKIILVPFFKLISGFLYIGEENRKFYKYYGVPDKKLFFMPYAVDNDFFFKKYEELKPRREELRAKYGIKPGDTVLLFVGKLIEKKNPGLLLEAYRKLKPEKPNLKLVFVGDGRLTDELKNKSGGLDGVVFAGFKNQTELPEFYTLADILVLPSGMGETWGLVVNEAMCFGLPVLVSDLVGCGPDLVLDEENDYRFKPDSEEIADSIRKIISVGTKKMGEKSREIISRHGYKEDVDGLEKALSLVRK